MPLLIKSARRLGLFLFSVALASGLPGCWSYPKDAGQYAKVSGKVTFKGEPLADAIVTFVPVDMKNNAEPAEGKTDQNGAFFLSRRRDNDGARIGKNHVVIEKRGPNKPIPPGKIYDPETTEIPGDPLIPVKYLSAKTTDLEFEVMAGGNTGADFDLEE